MRPELALLLPAAFALLSCRARPQPQPAPPYPPPAYGAAHGHAPYGHAPYGYAPYGYSPYGHGAPQGTSGLPPAPPQPARSHPPAAATSAPPRAPQVRWYGADHQLESGLGAAAAEQRGKASYYADSLAGNATASGEIYDPERMSAAHRSLPFGTIVDVVRSDGRWVRVRINDRGPFVTGRVIDLSRRAAELLGMVQAGVVDVSLFVVTRR